MTKTTVLSLTMLSLNSVQPFCNSQRTKLHFCYTLEAHLSKSNSLYYGCSNIRHYNRHNNTLLLRCLCHHNRRHLQKPQFLIPNTLFPNTPLSPPASKPSINLGVLPDFVLAQIEKMSKIESLLKQICFCLIISISLGLVIFGSSLSAEAHQCNHGHGHDHDHQGHHHHHHHGMSEVKQRKLPEELAEEEDLKLLGFGSHDDMDVHHHHNGDGAKDLTGLGLWVNAMGCSLLVSLASLICLIILPVIFLKGKPSKAVVDSLALFGAGAMLGDAFLHQLPHAFGGGHSHSHDHHVEHDHLHDHSGHSHAHSLEDLSVGLSILAGIVLFLIVEKLVRYVEDFSGGADEWSHGHHHHHHRHTHITKLKDDNDANDNDQELSPKKSGNLSEKTAGGSEVDGVSADSPNGEKPSGGAVLRKRNTGSSAADDNTVLDAANCSTNSESVGKEQAKSRSSLVFGYLNLFSDGVHNFTDGMALGSAFLLYGSVGGWSRTLFLLAHELPQEIGDFGILVRSGFSVSKALFFNFLSALVALAGTALALTLGQDSGQSSLIEGFTAGGFIYISVAGVLAEMNSSGRTTLMNTVIQLISLISGMAVALCISLVE